MEGKVECKSVGQSGAVKRVGQSGRLKRVGKEGGGEGLGKLGLKGLGDVEGREMGQSGGVNSLVKEEGYEMGKEDTYKREEPDVTSEVSANEYESENESDDYDTQDILGKDGYVWSQKPKILRRTPMRNIVTQKPGPKGNGCQADTPLKAFDLFFDDSMITEIVTWTNQKIENVKVSYIRNAGFLYQTNVVEIRALIGILLFLGATKNSKESTASIWSKDSTGKPICISAMSQKLFLLLVYCLRFDNSTTRAQRRANDKLACVRDIFGKFVKACEANYTPGTGCTVDESLLAFRGRCSFKQYIPNKPSKYGIKIYVLADSKTFYSVSSKIYMGAGTHAPGMQVPTQAVLDLVPTISGTNRNITTDNYYTSIDLANELKSRNLTLVGTMKKNKACIPPSFFMKAAEGTVQ
ncbi:piggyBac transposable element-derived protein 4-like [Physella acuta]|uniref:piggyBac transposable element-derived protein 4-like n=1 Tax=Physella acuta TaxID=109671 RepID=UPI0027DE74F5|nr:piggyBac transposable element-derived protein 4-like [Physella acuta]